MSLAWLKKIIPSKMKRSLCYEHDREFGTTAFGQEGEDILLHKLTSTQDKGYYVDIGAFHPIKFSNTYALYKRGWRGICVEPNPDLASPFQLLRPEDVFVNKGVASEATRLKYHKYQLAPLNTFSEQRAKELEPQYSPKEILEIEVLPISTILDQHLPTGKRIDVLSVDVEGMDLEVLKSNDWGRYLPYLVICESLHTGLEELLGSDLNRFMTSMGYTLLSKLHRSVFYQLATPDR